ncbi:MAG TPA: hypothetical protein VFO60_11780 [Candidatus Dormibacteraeota bacterium]|nr:hypothetical protein [Candidatus Dormibacteraeota bacterium]
MSSRLVATLLLGVASVVPAAARVVAAAASGQPAVGGCPTLPADNVWNTDISSLPVSSRSAAWIASSGGPGRLLHPDWGPSGTSTPYGIPWQVVGPGHQKVPVTFQYASESDPGPYPLGPDTPIEGGASSGGDRHALVVDSGTCTLYETWSTYYVAPPGTSHAGSGAIFDLRSDALRPAGWTSADAAGLPILPGLVRYDEVAAGAIRHAVRFTVSSTDRSYIWPARHEAGSASNPSLPPMGARFRMRASVDISRFSAQAQVILRAMQHYGLILADNGSNWYVQGDADPRWTDGVLSELKTIPAGDFEAVDESSLMVSPASGQARQSGGATAPAPPAPTPRRTPVPTPRPAATPAIPAATPSPSPAAVPSTPAVAVAPGPSGESPSAGARSGPTVATATAGASATGGAGGTGRLVAVGAGLPLLGGGIGLLAWWRRRRVPR